ncbi:MAG: outer membrane protein assembly factor BamD [Paludibacter sp.]|nr:MAG: outer membrane protein assembly factor BamD [Paludibacter sp.]
MKKRILYISILAILFASCTEFQKISKSKNIELKYDKAVDYYSNKKYSYAISLFEDIAANYRNDERSELIINYLAKSHIGKKQYYSAKDYYEAYIKTFPKGKFIHEAKYMIGYCDYKNMPDVQLDQSITKKAIKEFEAFIEEYPQSKKARTASDILEELYNQLAEKELLNATLYYNLGLYLGNNYLSAVITAENALKLYPSNKFREDFLILILRAKYEQALYSVEKSKNQRYQETIDEYYSYINEFPEGKYNKEAKKIFKKSQKVKKVENE